MKYLIRLLVVPFILPLIVISFSIEAIRRVISWVKFGGELVLEEDKLKNR